MTTFAHSEAECVHCECPIDVPTERVDLGDDVFAHADCEESFRAELEDSDFYDDSMDGDHDTAMRDAGWGTDEDYGYFPIDEY